jgi:3-oxoacyl-[acyl-carrier-protein] synthase II
VAARSDDVVITGVGVVSPLGIGVDAFWESVQAGRTGIRRCQLFPGFAAPDQVGAEVRDFTDDAARKIYLKDHRKNIKAMCREIQLGVASAGLALQHSGLNLEAMNRERLGVEFGANLMLSAPDILSDACVACAEPPEQEFHAERWGELGFPKMEPLWLLRYLPNMPACHISIASDARGPSNSLTLDDASGCVVIGEAVRVLKRNAADVIITGSTGTTLHPIKTLHLALWGDLARTPSEPERRARPFDRDRAGRVVAEGACSLILERREHAEARGAKIWGTILGAGSSAVTDRKGHPLLRQALAGAMRSALRAADLRPDQIGHINAHGLGTQDADIAEAQAILDVFGSELGRAIPVTAPKSLLGNAGAGAGLQELAVSLMGLVHGVVPVTRNYETPDPECPLNVVHGSPLPTDNRVVLTVNVTRAGQASAAIVQVA